MKKKSYYPSKQYNGYTKKSSKKQTQKQDVILVHRINVCGWSRQMAEEYMIEYFNLLPKNFGNLNIFNIVLPIGENSPNHKNDIKLLYPDLKMVKNEIKEYLDIFQKRKLNIEILKQII